MSNRVMMYVLILLVLPSLVFARANVPTNVTLSATLDTIDVDWSGDNNADGYYVYWGTVSDSLENRVTVDKSPTKYTITGLDPGTTYYVAVSAYDNSQGETDLSETKSMTTESDTEAPATPTGFDVTSLDDITGDSVSFKWNANTDTDMDHYNIYYGTSSGAYEANTQAGDSDAASFAVTGLTGSKRYYFSISAVDSSGNESEKSRELIVDTLEDNLPPNPPAGITAELSGLKEITVQVENGNENMVDYAGSIIYYGTASGEYDSSIDIGEDPSHAFGDLAEGSTWYFAASSYDQHGNESGKTSQQSVKVESTRPFINQSDGFEGGCFIDSCQGSGFPGFGWFILILCLLLLPVGYRRLKKSALILFVPAVLFLFTGYADAWEPAGNNTVGLAAGYYYPAESDFKDYYGEDTYPVFASYERRLFKYFSADIESGYLKENGHVLTGSGASTDIDSEITLVPVSASLKFNIPIMPYISGFVGVGPDYWYFREKTDIQGLETQSDWVGGFHGKLGFKLYNTDERYEGTGAVVEAVYSQVDRFGGNDTDIGGLIFKFGIFYQF